MNKKKKFLGGLLFIAVFAAAIAIVMLLWNALIPFIIGWTTISYWQAAGLMILCRLLLGGFGRFGRGRFGKHTFSHNRHNQEEWNHMHDMITEQMKDMSREERLDYIRKHMKEQHGFGGGFFGRCKERTEDKD